MAGIDWAQACFPQYQKGIDAAGFDRHTAMGDVLWTKAQWDVMTNG